MTQKKTKVNPIEQYFEWYLQELKDCGYIKDFFREPETLTVAETSTALYTKRMKSKTKHIEINLFPKIRLTYDYLIIWNDIAEYFFYEVIEPHNVLFQLKRPLFIAHKYPLYINGEVYSETEIPYSYIDVKTLSTITRFGSNSTSYTFPLKQRMLYDSFGIYVNKIVPIPAGKKGFKQSLFLNSFTPKRYMFTDKSGQLRKINWPTQTLSEFLKKKEEEIKASL